MATTISRTNVSPNSTDSTDGIDGGTTSEDRIAILVGNLSRDDKKSLGEYIHEMNRRAIDPARLNAINGAQLTTNTVPATTNDPPTVTPIPDSTPLTDQQKTWVNEAGTKSYGDMGNDERGFLADYFDNRPDRLPTTFQPGSYIAFGLGLGDQAPKTLRSGAVNPNDPLEKTAGQWGFKYDPQTQQYEQPHPTRADQIVPDPGTRRMPSPRGPVTSAALTQALTPQGTPTPPPPGTTTGDAKTPDGVHYTYTADPSGKVTIKLDDGTTQTFDKKSDLNNPMLAQERTGAWKITDPMALAASDMASNYDLRTTGIVTGADWNSAQPKRDIQVDKDGSASAVFDEVAPGFKVTYNAADKQLYVANKDGTQSVLDPNDPRVSTAQRNGILKALQHPQNANVTQVANLDPTLPPRNTASAQMFMGGSSAGFIPAEHMVTSQEMQWFRDKLKSLGIPIYNDKAQEYSLYGVQINYTTDARSLSLGPFDVAYEMQQYNNGSGSQEDQTLLNDWKKFQSGQAF
jgi:hypothetical protein